MTFDSSGPGYWTTWTTEDVMDTPSYYTATLAVIRMTV